MLDELKRCSFFLAHNKGVEQEEMIEFLISEFTTPDEVVACPVCNVNIKWRNLLKHSMKNHQVKVRWNNISVVRKQKDEKRKIKKAVGEIPKAIFVNGGSPGLKKR